jgi:hypothetical protein
LYSLESDEKTPAAPHRSSATEFHPNNTAAPLFVIDDSSDERLLESIATKRGLNREQRIAFYRIGTHFLQQLATLADPSIETVAPLRMFIEGPGGTGKTHIIQAVQELFAHRKRSNWMEMMAFMGSAASAIGGRTMHSLLKLPRNETYKELRGGEKKALETTLKGIRYIIVDEVSMVSQQMLHAIDQRCREACNNREQSFGGISMIFLGDFIQFPPTNGTSLFIPGNPKTMKNSIEAAQGYMLWNGSEADPKRQSYGLTDCVQLLQQWRQNDRAYLAMLTRLRNGKCTRDDWDMLRSRGLCDENDVYARDTFDRELLAQRQRDRDRSTLADSSAPPTSSSSSSSQSSSLASSGPISSLSTSWASHPGLSHVNNDPVPLPILKQAEWMNMTVITYANEVRHALNIESVRGLTSREGELLLVAADDRRTDGVHVGNSRSATKPANCASMRRR